MSDIGLGHAYLSGVLLAMTRSLLASPPPPQPIMALFRAELERIEQVLVTEGWTLDDIRAAVNEPVAA